MQTNSYSINLTKSMMSIFWLLMSVLLLGCGHSKQNYAPVVDAWREPISKQGMHKVESGETLYSIAWRYGFDYREIAKINHIPAPYSIHVGQKIYLVHFTQSKSQPAVQKIKPKTVSTSVPKKVQQSDNSTQKINSKPIKIAETPASLPIKEKSATSTKGMKWNWPTNGKIISGYTKEGLANKGIDIAGKKGQPIYATAAGEVVYSGNGLFGYGNLIIIKHNSEYLSAYAHNDKNLVKEGMKITALQKIAEMGDSGSNRVKLHFEIRRAGKPVDPMFYLPSQS